jgi:hypothetical protein
MSVDKLLIAYVPNGCAILATGEALFDFYVVLIQSIEPLRRQSQSST